jgi:lipopolysaccharide transport protein LptA
MAYGTREGWLELKSDVRAEWPIEEGEDAPPPVRLRASRALYDKRAGTVQLSGPVQFTQGNRRVGSASGTLSLDERNRISRASLEGGVRASDESERARLEASAERVAGEFDAESGNLVLVEAVGNLSVRSERPGSVSALRAAAGRVHFAGRPPQPVTGRALGDVQLRIESASAPLAAAAPSATRLETKELSASEIEFAFRPGGESLRDARALDEGTLVIVPADRRVGRRVVKALEMLMAFDANNRLESLRGTGGTEVIFHPAPGAAQRAEPAISRADRLTAEFDPATQSLRAAQQTGNYRFQEGAREARAERAEYSARRETLTLLGKPELRDETARVKAEQILFNLARDTAEAAGQVQATHAEPSVPANTSRAATNVLADRMTADRRSGFARYEGNVRVWQGYDVLESSELEVFAESRRIRSASRVRTSHLRPGSVATSDGQQPDSQPAVIEADGLDYFDQGRRARYRGNVTLRAAKTTLVADRMDVEFRERARGDGAEVERAVADGNVRVEQPLRRATGQHAEYFAGEGRIELTGGPPALYDEEKGFTTGRRLTFLIHDDTLRVDGAQQSPTISKHRVTQ